ncbi:acyl-CoA dehydrogenase [Fodinicurvata sp. EGI_FJ10296]|uniref:acyl-CoA dehydrogenase n=1 Tax=Fodinicurvata sp. EGI_FJ10296 TaxID=3231908 RepID=UPI0034532AEB
MAAYSAPIAEMRFILSSIVGLDTLNTLPGYEDATADLVDAILEEAAKLADQVIAPLNAIGDRHGATLNGNTVSMPPGFAEAYAQYRDGGWNAIPFNPEFGGQGLPWAVATAVQEMWHSANMAFGLCPTLNQGAVEALDTHGTAEQKTLYLPKLIAGTWTGTMNLTEPQAGTDLGAVRCRAERLGNGSFGITGQKIFITYGDHDLAENIIHLVLARVPGAPAGVKGISLFLVPKFLPDDRGEPGLRNDAHCVGIEHKLGIHASPTCVMSYGDNGDGGAVGFLIGEENRGLEYMFTMMNNARLAVGLQGVAIAERARQQALAHARDRVQGRPIGGDQGHGSGAPAIVEHPDVRRMLLDMRSRTDMARTLAYYVAARLDVAKKHPDAGQRDSAQKRVDLLIPVVKAYATDLGVDVASMGIQVHGGMGYIEETGAAQHLRDARIAPIYEGTNGIQANDLVFRKTARDGGGAMTAYIADIRDVAANAARIGGPVCGAVAEHLNAGIDTLELATKWIVETASSDPARAAAASSRFLECVGLVACGHMAAMSVIAATDNPETAPPDKQDLCRYFAEQWLSRAPGLSTAIMAMADLHDYAIN